MEVRHCPHKGAPRVVPGASSARVAASGCVRYLVPEASGLTVFPESLPLVLIGLKEGELPLAKVPRA